MEKYYLLDKRYFILIRVFFHAILFAFILIDISCVHRSDEHQNASKIIEPVKKINIDHFLIFNFESNVDDVIQLLRTKKINFNYPITVIKDGIESKYIKVLNFPIGSGKLSSVDLYFFENALYLIEHDISFRENCYCLASEYNSFMNEIFSGLFEKYGNPTAAINFHFHIPEVEYQLINLFCPEYDTIVEHITKSSWHDWQYLNPAHRQNSSTDNKLEIGWIGKTGGIIIKKTFEIYSEPYKEKIDRAKRPDYLPPLPNEYEDGKIYTFYKSIFESNFNIHAHSQKMTELTKRYKEFSKQKDKIKENSTRDSIEKKTSKLINEL